MRPFETGVEACPGVDDTTPLETLVTAVVLHAAGIARQGVYTAAINADGYTFTLHRANDLVGALRLFRTLSRPVCIVQAGELFYAREATL